ncbi:MAG: MerR family transcriptional regulator [Planctomycetes bacterium]|nr:MerR family transcriptional regulator [Planctomycetota bacterium]
MRFEALKVGELARRTGLTIRTLHHYDDIGLLKPSLHTETGHRLYTAGDVARLQRVISLRQLGFPLEEVRDCLDRPDFSPLKVIGLHLARLREQIEWQRKLCERLEAIAARLRTAGEVSAEEFLQTIEVMTMTEKLYTPEQMKQFEEAGKLVGPEEIQAVQEAWGALLTEVRANRDLDPASPQAQALAQRWEELTERTMRGYQPFPELKQAIADNYKQGKFEGDTRAPQAADFAFIERVKAARQASGEKRRRRQLETVSSTPSLQGEGRERPSAPPSPLRRGTGGEGAGKRSLPAGDIPPAGKFLPEDGSGEPSSGRNFLAGVIRSFPAPSASRRLNPHQEMTRGAVGCDARADFLVGATWPAWYAHLVCSEGRTAAVRPVFLGSGSC